MSEMKHQSLQPFPKSKEEAEFPTWLFKARALFLSLGYSDYVDHPVRGMPVLEADRVRQHEADFAPVYDHPVVFIGSLIDSPEIRAKQVQTSYKAYNLLVQSLNAKQIHVT